MGKKTTSVFLLVFLVVLQPALAGYWSNSGSPRYQFPSFPEDYEDSWQESPIGIFAYNFDDCTDDTTNPTASNPADINVQCAADVPAVDISVVTDEVDNCTTNPTVAFVSDVSDGNFNPEVITRTYSVTDESGNSINVTQQITVEDTTDPTASNPAPVTVECTADIPAVDPSVVTDEADNCTTNSTVAFVSDVSDGNFNPEVITRTYSVTDESGNSINVTQQITVEDITDPTATNPAPITVECTADIPAVDPSVVTDEADNCTTNSTVAFVSDVSDGNFNPEVITRTYSVTDESGNSINVTQQITVEDTTDPTATNPAPITVECTADIPAVDPSVVTDEADNCTTNSTVAFVSDVSDGNFNPEVITRTYSVTDESGNSINVTQQITVEDTTDPTATNPAPITVECTADIPAVDPSVVTDEADNCTTNPTVAFVSDVSDGNFNPEVITRTYSVTDESGNSINVTQQITVEDTTDPTASNPAPISVECTADIPAVDPSVVTDEADNCTTNPTVAFVSDVSDGNFNPEVITRTYSVTDESGNSINVTQQITVEDTTDPTATNPAPITVECTADIPAVDISVVTDEADNCTSTPAVSFVKEQSDGRSNPEIITRTYRVTDDAGNYIDVNQKITVNDTTKPTITAPSAKTVNTSDDGAGNCSTISPLGSPTASDNCEVDFVKAYIGTTEIDPTTYQFPIGKTTVTWKVTDKAGLENSATQDITVKDDELPKIAAVSSITASNDTGYCSASVAIAPPTATDNCSVETPSGTRDDGLALTDPYPVGTTIITWTVTDVNGNAANSVEQTVTVEDNEAPIAPQIDDILWGCQKTLEAPTTTDNCSGTITATANRSLTFSSSGNITWTFTDEAGNSTQVVQNVTIDPVTAQAEKVNILCHGDSTGEIKITGSGGVAPYAYLWADGATGEERTGLTAGTYNVTVSDANACQTSLEIILTEPDPLTIAESTVTPVTCNSAADGTFTAGTVTGGNPQYEYKITGGNYQATGHFSDLSPGNYTLTIRDLNGCFLEEDFTITEPEELQMEEPTSTKVTCFGGNDGTVTAGSVTGGNEGAGYLYSLNNTDYQTETVFSGLTAGTYTIFVKDEKGCALQKSVTVEQAQILSANVQKTDVTCFEAENGKITIVNPSGGSGSYEFSKDGENWQPEPNFTDLDIGSYPISMRDAAHPDCIMPLSSSIEIEQPSQLGATVTTNHTTTYGSATGSATVNPSGGTAGYTYEWRLTADSSVITTTKTANNLPAGEYEVTVTDLNGCEITVHPVIIRDAVFAEIESATICEGDNIIENQIRTAYFRIANLTAVGGFGNYEYTWDFGNGTTATGPGRTRNYLHDSGQ